MANCSDLFRKAVCGAICGFIFVLICSIFILPFAVTSYIYIDGMDEISLCANEDVTKGWWFTYQSGYYFALLNVIFVGAFAFLALISFIPCTGFIGWILSIPATCGCCGFLVMGILILCMGLSVDLKELSDTQKQCVERKGLCCIDIHNCTVDFSSSPTNDETSEFLPNDCYDTITVPYEFNVKIVGSMLIVGSTMMCCYNTISTATSGAYMKKGKRDDYENLS